MTATKKTLSPKAVDRCHAIAEFTEHGYKATSMDKISRAETKYLNTHRLQPHFASKELLLEEILDSIWVKRSPPRTSLVGWYLLNNNSHQSRIKELELLSLKACRLISRALLWVLPQCGTCWRSNGNTLSSRVDWQRIEAAQADGHSRARPAVCFNSIHCTHWVVSALFGRRSLAMCASPDTQHKHQCWTQADLRCFRLQAVSGPAKLSLLSFAGF